MTIGQLPYLWRQRQAPFASWRQLHLRGDLSTGYPRPRRLRLWV